MSKHTLFANFNYLLLIMVLIFACSENDPVVVTGSIEGTVVDAETNQPVNTVKVTIVANNNTSFVEQNKFTGSDGKFSFKDIEAGNYKLSFNKEGYEMNHSNISVTATQTSSGDIAISPIKPVLNVSVLQLDFSTTTPSLPIQITNSGKGTLQWSIVNNLPWISVNPSSGNVTTQSSSATITVDRSGQTQGIKTGSVVINSNGGSATIAITMNVPGPVLSVNPLNLDFGDIETEKSLQITNSSGVGTLTYQAIASNSWITLINAAGSLASESKIISVKVSRADLSPGNFSGNVVINSNNNTVTVPIVISVLQPTLPEALNGVVSGITYNSAQVTGNLISLGSSAVIQYGHCWSTSPNPTTTDNKTQLGGANAASSFNSILSGLSPNMTYYVRAYATSAVGTKYSDQLTFTTLPIPTFAVVQTLNAENVTHEQARINGNLSSLGDGFVTDYGFCYSSSNPTPHVSDIRKSIGSTSQTGQFNGTLTGLIQMTKYYVRAYATNSIGTVYGNIIEITTPNAPPLVTNGLLAYYTFNDQNTNDWTGNNNGIPYNISYTSNTINGSGYSIQLNGKDSYIYLPTFPLKGLNSKTFCFWFKSLTGGGLWGTRDGGLGGYNFIHFGIGILESRIRVSSGGNHYLHPNLIDNYLDNQWHHLCVIIADGQQKVYLDGSLFGILTSSTNHSAESPSYIGFYQYGNPSFFNGSMDNVRVYNRGLTIQEIQQIFQQKQ